MLRIATLLLITAAAHAQTTDVLLSQLLQEVQQMRRDLSVMGLTAQRIQLVLYRLQIQQQAVARAQNRADQVNARIASMERFRNEGQDMVRQVEIRLAAEQDPARRRQFEMELQAAKRIYERTTQEDPQLRTDEADAQRDLRNEQVKVQELQQKLDEMEKTLERLAQPQR